MTLKFENVTNYEHDEDENLQLYSKFVNRITAFYYKFHKYKRIELTCPKCQRGFLHLIKKRTTKNILNTECPVCEEPFKDILEELEMI